MGEDLISDVQPITKGCNREQRKNFEIDNPISRGVEHLNGMDQI